MVNYVEIGHLTMVRNFICVHSRLCIIHHTEIHFNKWMSWGYVAIANRRVVFYCADQVSTVMPSVRFRGQQWCSCFWQVDRTKVPNERNRLLEFELPFRFEDSPKRIEFHRSQNEVDRGDSFPIESIAVTYAKLFRLVTMKCRCKTCSNIVMKKPTNERNVRTNR